MISKLKKFILSGFVNNCGLVVRPVIFQYEGKPEVGYVVYQKWKFFWIPRYMFVEAIADIEDLIKKYGDVKINY